MNSLFYHFLSTVLRVFFDLLYHQMAWTYDLVAWLVSLGRWNDWIAAILEDIEGPRVLELGHGPGHLQLALHERGHLVFGLDRSRQMGRIAQQRLHKHSLTAKLVRGIGQQLPFQTGAFNQVVATFPTEYIFLPQTLKEIYRILAPGGKCIILPVAWITGGNLLDRMAAWLFEITGQAEDIKDEKLAQGFQAAGFETRIERRDLDGSKLLIIHASKPLT